MVLPAAAHSVKDNDSSTALMEAVKEGRESVVKVLLEKGTDHSIKDNGGWTALMNAGESFTDNNNKCPLCRKNTTGIMKIYI